MPHVSLSHFCVSSRPHSLDLVYPRDCFVSSSSSLQTLETIGRFDLRVLIGWWFFTWLASSAYLRHHWRTITFLCSKCFRAVVIGNTEYPRVSLSHVRTRRVGYTTKDSPSADCRSGWCPSKTTGTELKWQLGNGPSIGRSRCPPQKAHLLLGSNLISSVAIFTRTVTIIYGMLPEIFQPCDSLTRF